MLHNDLTNPNSKTNHFAEAQTCRITRHAKLQQNQKNEVDTLQKTQKSELENQTCCRRPNISNQKANHVAEPSVMLRNRTLVMLNNKKTKNRIQKTKSVVENLHCSKIGNKSRYRKNVMSDQKTNRL